MDECAQATQSIEDSVHLLLINPYVDMDSQFRVHQDEIALYYGILEPKRRLTYEKDINNRGLTLVQRRAWNKLLKKVGKDLNESSYLDMIGQRIIVTWTAQQGAAGKWSGEVIDFEPKLDKHWIKYDVMNDEGAQCFPQDCLTNVWQFE